MKIKKMREIILQTVEKIKKSKKEISIIELYAEIREQYPVVEFKIYRQLDDEEKERSILSQMLTNTTTKLIKQNGWKTRNEGKSSRSRIIIFDEEREDKVPPKTKITNEHWKGVFRTLMKSFMTEDNFQKITLLQRLNKDNGCRWITEKCLDDILEIFKFQNIIAVGDNPSYGPHITVQNRLLRKELNSQLDSYRKLKSRIKMMVSKTDYTQDDFMEKLGGENIGWIHDALKDLMIEGYAQKTGIGTWTKTKIEPERSGNIRQKILGNKPEKSIPDFSSFPSRMKEKLFDKLVQEYGTRTIKSMLDGEVNLLVVAKGGNDAKEI